jgi:toxin secretion/phage lysis holin
MNKLFNIWSVFSGIAGGILTFMFGGFDILLKVLITLVILDYITGLIKGIYKKELSSETGFKGLLKKILLFIIVIVAVVIQQLINDSIPIRETVIVFFICNEGISIIENAAEFIPIPKKLKEVLLQIREKNEGEKENEEN